MQLASLLERTGCPEPTLKEWLRRKLLVPAHAGKGPGVHAQYDEANLITAALALQMKQAHIVVSRYSRAFRELQLWLRTHSALEWPEYQVVLTPERADLILTRSFRGPIRGGFVADLADVTKRVGASQGTGGNQIPLFDLQVVDR